VPFCFAGRQGARRQHEEIEIMQTEQMEKKSSGRAASGKYLTLVLGRESYGIDVLKIREIIRLTGITSVPNMPDYVRGVINLRGKIIPVLDLRRKFKLGEAADSEHTCIVVVQVRRTLAGIIVDGVEEVTNIPATDIEPTPDFGTDLDTEYILGMAKVKGAVKALLDIEKVITTDITNEKLLATAAN
jgi:purine-binding chemotaxis protein CheW